MAGHRFGFSSSRGQASEQHGNSGDRNPPGTQPVAGAGTQRFTPWLVLQAYAPLEALFAVRTAGQRSHNQVELKLLQEKWAGKVNIKPQRSLNSDRGRTGSSSPATSTTAFLAFDCPPAGGHRERMEGPGKRVGMEKGQNFLDLTRPRDRPSSRPRGRPCIPRKGKRPAETARNKCPARGRHSSEI